MKSGRRALGSEPAPAAASRNEQELSPPLGAAQASDAELAPERPPRCAAAAGLASAAAGTPPLRAATRPEPSIAPHPLQGSHPGAAL